MIRLLKHPIKPRFSIGVIRVEEKEMWQSKKELEGEELEEDKEEGGEEEEGEEKEEAKEEKKTRDMTTLRLRLKKYLYLSMTKILSGMRKRRRKMRRRKPMPSLSGTYPSGR